MLSSLFQLLFQETNPGVRYEFVVKKNSSEEPQYLWRYGAWTDCSATCGQGEEITTTTSAAVQ